MENTKIIGRIDRHWAGGKNSIFGMIYDELKAKIEHLPGKYAHYTDVLDALDREAFGDIILDGNTFWVEDGTGEYTDTTYAKLINYIVNHKGLAIHDNNNQIY